MINIEHLNSSDPKIVLMELKRHFRTIYQEELDLRYDVDIILSDDIIYINKKYNYDNFAYILNFMPFSWDYDKKTTILVLIKICQQKKQS